MKTPASLFSLSGKTALITGGASGIGEAIASRFAAAGAHVIVADRDEPGGAAVAARIEKEGASAEFLSLDVADERACEAIAADVLARRGRLEILVNNAGIGHVGTLLTTSTEDLDRLYRVNLRGMFGLTKAFSRR